MAPERFEPQTGAPVEPAADIFSWGAVVTFAGTGREPFQAPTAMATAARIVTEEPDLDGLPAGLRSLVAAALAKDPSQRPTARDLLDRLLHSAATAHGATVLRAQPDLRAAVEAVTLRHTVTAPSRRRRWAPIAVVAAVVIGAGSGIPLLTRSDKAPTVAAPSPVTRVEWIGELKQSFGSAEPVHLSFALDADRGTVTYPRLGCTGTVTVTSRTTEKIVLAERIAEGRCSPRGEIVLWPTGPDTMLLDYTPDSGRYTARASMTRG